jgi:hypothetical protein
MHAITVDQVAAAALAAATDDVEVWDEGGRLIGLFVPEYRRPAVLPWGEVPQPGRVQVCGVAAEKLRAADAECRLWDAAGGLLGHLLPHAVGSGRVRPGMAGRFR